MSMTPSVSVVIPTYNRGDSLVEAVESALGQTLPPMEILVVDDGSEDDIAGLLRERVADHRVCCIRQNNSGPARARNRGIQTAKGEFIAFLDSDDLWLPQKLEKQVRVLQQHPQARLATCGTRFTDISGEVYHVHQGLSRLPRMWQLLNVNMSTLIAPREALGDGFDESFTYLEDKELCLRLGLEGELVMVDEVLVQARRLGSSITSRLARDPQILEVYDRDISRFWEQVRGLPGFRPNDLRHLRRKVAILRHDLGEYALRWGMIRMSRRNLLWAWHAHPRRLETLLLLLATFPSQIFQGVKVVDGATQQKNGGPELGAR